MFSNKRRATSTFASAVLAVAIAGLAGCESSQSRPINYGTDGNRGVTAPSAGVPQNVGSGLGGQVITPTDSARPAASVAGSSGAVDPTGSTRNVTPAGQTGAGATDGATGVVNPTPNTGTTSGSGSGVRGGG